MKETAEKIKLNTILYGDDKSIENLELLDTVIKQSLTDYHNHIVEKIVKDVDMTDQQLQDILSLLQDTNK